MNEKEIILEAMKKAGEPLNAGKVAELTGLDRKVVDKAFAERKKDGSIVSPVRCKWEPAAKETARKPTVPIAPRTKEAGGRFVILLPHAGGLYQLFRRSDGIPVFQLFQGANDLVQVQENEAGAGFLLIEDSFQLFQTLVVRLLLTGEIQVFHQSEHDLAAAVFLVIQGLVRLQDGQIPGQPVIIPRRSVRSFRGLLRRPVRSR